MDYDFDERSFQPEWDEGDLIETELSPEQQAALLQIETDYLETIAATPDPEKRQAAWDARIKALKALLGEESE